MSQEQYYYSPDNGASWVGPFDAQQLNELRAAGVIQPTFLIQSAGGGAMQTDPLSQLPLPPSSSFPQSQGYPQTQGILPMQNYQQPQGYPQAPSISPVQNYQQHQGIPLSQGYAQSQSSTGYVPSSSSAPPLIRGLFTVSFTGRMRRKDYWLSQVLICVIAFIFGFIMGASADGIGGIIGSVVAVAIGILLIGLGIVALGMSVRRLHDIGKSGWLILLSLIPYIGSIILFVMFCMDSQRGANQWGPNPKGY